ncbi:uncharacterized protein C1orf131 homolog isoform X2 [Hemicordylus capensis]|uniref:uncharacterized protein C1orf131 homolog isoform X2 n=1 Tax=Hemicordylus capensis TaxID=884348 RepID=UPI0023040AA5|nr:uncharacterized protein C1orf131 homolog isoform X2 [Hemicordylus capensis]
MAAGSRAAEQELEKKEEDLASASCLLDTVLSSLYDFGESVLDANKKRKGKKKNSQGKLGGKTGSNLLEDRDMNLESDTVASGKRKNASSFFENLKNELAHECATQKRPVSESHTPDGVSPPPSRQGAAISVVTFHSRKRKKNPKAEIADNGDSKAKTTVQEKLVDDQFNLEKARLEVHRFGITGFEKKEQRVLEQERAIMLGAKAPKKEYVNYKTLQEKIKKNKAMKKEETVMENKSDSLKRRRKRGHEDGTRKSKKKTKHSILPTGQVGKFKNGTLILRSSDIKKIKSSKVAK